MLKVSFDIFLHPFLSAEKSTRFNFFQDSKKKRGERFGGYLLEGFRVKLGPPMAQERFLRVAIKAAGETLEGALPNHIRHIFQ